MTEAGQAYIDTLNHIRCLEEDLSRRIEYLRGLQTGTLRLGGTNYLNCYILAPIIAGFTGKYPGIQLELYEDSAVRLQARLQKRELDLTFSCAPEIVGLHIFKSSGRIMVYLIKCNYSAPWGLSPKARRSACAPNDFGLSPWSGQGSQRL